MLDEGISNAYFSASLATGAFALWNIRKSHHACELALNESSKGLRPARVADIYNQNLRASTFGLISVVVGMAGLAATQIAYDHIPRWTWFAAFMLSGFAINALGSSISIQFASDLYKNNPKHAEKIIKASTRKS